MEQRLSCLSNQLQVEKEIHLHFLGALIIESLIVTGFIVE